MEGRKIKILPTDNNGVAIEIEGKGVEVIDTSYLDAYNQAQRESLAVLDPDDERFLVYDVAEDVYTGVLKELGRQFEKFGRQFHTVETWNSITIEEYGEMVSAMNKQDWDDAWKEGIEMIACAVQLLNEVKRQQNGIAEGDYTRQG